MIRFWCSDTPHGISSFFKVGSWPESPCQLNSLLKHVVSDSGQALPGPTAYPVPGPALPGPTRYPARLYPALPGTRPGCTRPYGPTQYPARPGPALPGPTAPFKKFQDFSRMRLLTFFWTSELEFGRF